MLERLNAEKASLIAQRDQVAATLNAIGGAIQFCDKLIADETAAQIVAKVAEQAPPTIAPAPAPAPEMLPVAKFAPCDECSTPNNCAELGYCTE